MSLKTLLGVGMESLDKLPEDILTLPLPPGETIDDEDSLTKSLEIDGKTFGEVSGLDPSSMLMPGLPPMGPSDGEKKPDDKSKDVLDPWESFDAQTAFLGPSLWDKRLPYDGHDFKLEYMDLEDFLTENGIPVDASNESGFSGSNKNGMLSPRTEMIPPVASPSSICSPQSPFPSSVQFMAGPSRASSHASGIPSLSRSVSSTRSHSSRSPSPSESSSSLMHEPASVTSENSQSADISLASVPGHDFDPRTRAFTDEELKPQPMTKKSKKQFVPDEAKDAKYWSRRKKNNMAAKRSRDARRVKENQIALRAGYLEKENHVMRAELERVQKENALLKEQLSRCSREH